MTTSRSTNQTVHVQGDDLSEHYYVTISGFRQSGWLKFEELGICGRPPFDWEAWRKPGSLELVKEGE